ncbi:MAG: YitT family protein, partial [Exiguobacterium sp.]|nr:YitT family protein [Exiguobacterium sp.]
GWSATLYQIQGAYSNESYYEITCVINRLEERKIKDIIDDVDSKAFVVVYEVTEVKGGNFQKRDIH